MKMKNFVAAALALAVITVLTTTYAASSRAAIFTVMVQTNGMVVAPTAGLTINPTNGLFFKERSSHPSTPPTNTVVIYGLDTNGVTRMWLKDDAGNIIEIGGGAGVTGNGNTNTFLDGSVTFRAIPLTALNTNGFAINQILKFNGTTFVAAADGGGSGSIYVNGGQVTDPNILSSATATIVATGTTNISVNPTNLTSSQLATDSVSADELNVLGVEAELEGALELQDLQGAVTDAQVPDLITINTFWENGLLVTRPNFIDSSTALVDSSSGTNVSVYPTNLTGAQLGTDSVGTDELNTPAVEAEIEAAIELQDLQGAVTDAQVPDTITVDSVWVSGSLVPRPNLVAGANMLISVTGGTNVSFASTGGGGGGGTNGITMLNGDTNSSQTFTVGTAGNNFNIATTSSVHTFNIPSASATDRGLLLSADWTTFNDKVGTNQVRANGTLVSNPNFLDSSTFLFGVASATNITGAPTNLANAQIAPGANIDKTKIATVGFWADTEVSTNVALKNGTNIFTGTNQFDGNVRFTQQPATRLMMQGADGNLTNVTSLVNLTLVGTTLSAPNAGGDVFQVDFADSHIKTNGPAGNSIYVTNLVGNQITDGTLAAADLGTDSVSADELNASGVASELEAVLSLQNLGGAVTDSQVPNNITVDLASLASTATVAFAGDSATAFFSAGTLENARLDSDLQALGDNANNGLWSRTGAGTGAARTITNGVGVAVTAGDGIAGNPTVRHNIEAGSGVSLTTNGTALVVTATGSGGTVTSVNVTSSPDFVSAGGPVTTAGTITLTPTNMARLNGTNTLTGKNTFTNHTTFTGNITNTTLSPTAAVVTGEGSKITSVTGTDGQVLRMAGGAPGFGTIVSAGISDLAFDKVTTATNTQPLFAANFTFPVTPKYSIETLTGATPLLDWNTQPVKFHSPTTNVNYSFTNSPTATNSMPALRLDLTNGNAFSITNTFPAAVKWVPDITPDILPAGKILIVWFEWDGRMIKGTYSGSSTNPLQMVYGGTGSALTDPGADRLMFWDDSAGVVTWLTAGSGLSIAGTTITATGSGLPSGGSVGQIITNTASGTGAWSSEINADVLNLGTPMQLNVLTNGSSAGQVVTWDGANVLWATPSGGAGSTNYDGLQITNLIKFTTTGSSNDNLIIGPAGVTNGLNFENNSVNVAWGGTNVVEITNLTLNVRAGIGTATAGGGIGWAEDNDGTPTKIYRSAANQIGVAVNGVATAFFDPANTFLIHPIRMGSASDLYIGRDAAATLQIGIDGASPLTNKIKGPDASGSNVGGGALRLAGGQGTGQGTPARVLIEVSTNSTSSGATAQNYATPVTLGGTLTVSTSTTGNVGTGEDDLILFSVPAAQLSANKDYLEVWMWGSFAANANAKQLKAVFGSTTLFDSTSLVLNGVDWKMHSIITRTGAATQTATTDITIGGTLLGALTTTSTDTTSPTETLANALTFKCTGTATSNDDIVQNGLIIRWHGGQ